MCKHLPCEGTHRNRVTCNLTGAPPGELIGSPKPPVRKDLLAGTLPPRRLRGILRFAFSKCWQGTQDLNFEPYPKSKLHVQSGGSHLTTTSRQSLEASWVTFFSTLACSPALGNSQTPEPRLSAYQKCPDPVPAALEAAQPQAFGRRFKSTGATQGHPGGGRKVASPLGRAALLSGCALRRASGIRSEKRAPGPRQSRRRGSSNFPSAL